MRLTEFCRWRSVADLQVWVCGHTGTVHCFSWRLYGVLAKSFLASVPQLQDRENTLLLHSGEWILLPPRLPLAFFPHFTAVGKQDPAAGLLTHDLQIGIFPMGLRASRDPAPLVPLSQPKVLLLLCLGTLGPGALSCGVDAASSPGRDGCSRAGRGSC